MLFTLFLRRGKNVNLTWTNLAIKKIVNQTGGGTDSLYEPREGQPGFFINFDIDTHHPPDWYPYQSGFCFQKLTPTPKRLLQTHTNFKSLRKNEHPPPKTRIKIKIIYFFCFK